MRTLLVTLVTVFLISVPFAQDADARRLGGGSSFGKSFSMPKKKTAPTQQQQAAPAQKQALSGTKKRSGFGGMMAGLLAGGLFGALLFGGAFDGLQMMDLILIAALIFIVYKLFFARKPMQQTAYATGGQQYEIKPHPQQREASPESNQSNFERMPSYSSGWGESDEPVLPEWFNKEAFLQGAQDHFITLQQAWDNQDWQSIKEYTSDEVFQHLQQERSKLPEQQITEVVSVMAEVANFIDNSDEAVVSINFYGWLKEGTAEATEFSEVWHLSRDMSVEGADWFIVGIEQHN